MRKEIDPELYNYNKFPGPVFRQVGDQILSENLSFELLKNEKEAFDATVFGQRFSEILTKFDYIVGDWSNEQLRLRGFYKEERDVATMDKLSRLDDYLLEYCSYGCAYFVLEIRSLIVLLLIRNHRSKKLNQKKENLKSVRAIANKKIVSKNENATRDNQPKTRKKQDRLLRPKRQRRQTTNVIL